MTSEHLPSEQVPIEARCAECDCVFFYTIDPNDPVHWKICDDCAEKGVIEP